MTAAQALAEIHRAANGNRVFFTYHSTVRMAERGASRRDVVRALRTATAAHWQDAHQTWLAAGGHDTDDDPLDVACTLDDGVLVVTIK